MTQDDTSNTLTARTQSDPKPKKTGGLDTARAKTLAKVGMTASLSALVITGFCKTRETRRLHLVAGAVLVGFSAWHYLLYQPTRKGPDS